MCPHCGQNAPIVYRGVTAVCAACGRPRTPLTAPSVSYAGKPSKVGGTLVGIAGWIVLSFGILSGVVNGLLAGLVSVNLGLIAGLLITVPFLILATVLLLSGRSLRRAGSVEAARRREQALFALAANRGGAITAADAAQALDLSVAEADTALTEMAKKQPDQLTVDVDNDGRIWFRFVHVAPQLRVPPMAPAGASRFDGSTGPSAEAQAEAEAAAIAEPRRTQR